MHLTAISAVTMNNATVSCPPEYEEIHQDCNDGAGGDYIYMCKSNMMPFLPQGADFNLGITGIAFVTSKTAACPANTKRLNVNFNAGTLSPFAKDIFMCVAGQIAVFPRHRHMALTGSTDMQFSFMTDGDMDWPVGVEYFPALLLATDIQGPFKVVNPNGENSDSSRTLTHYHHNILAKALPAETVLYYLVGDLVRGLSAPQIFKAPIDPATLTPFTIGVIGDMGLEGSTGTINMLTNGVKSDQLSWILHVGDISYADDRDVIGSNPVYDYTYDTYMQEIENFTKHVPYMVLPGNHDASCHPYGDLLCPGIQNNYTSFRSRFRMPFAQSQSLSNMFYSFDDSYVHFIQISTETDYPDAPDHPGAFSPFGHDAGPFGNQLEWLEKDLQQANLPENRAKRPWIIVSGHRAMYTTSQPTTDWPIDQSLKVQASFEPLLRKYNVDMYFSAHVHDYERNWPVYNNAVCGQSYINPNCTVHIVNGAGGNIEGHPFDLRAMQPFTAVRDTAAFGYAVMQVDKNIIHYEFHDQDKGKVDEFDLVKQ